MQAERLNVWAAYLNLEHKYGDGESLATIAERAKRNAAGSRARSPAPFDVEELEP